MPRLVIIDTDPGQDDAIALLLALASPELAVLGITCVAGNVPLPLTLANARKVCELAGRAQMRVFAGAAAPLVRPLVTAEYVHGSTGLDGIDLPAPTMPWEEDAAGFLVETLRAHPPGAVTLCALGPLTNIAEALRRAPDIAGRIGEIVLMGGAWSEGGNVTPAAEFNLHVDPEAAAAVLGCGAPVTMLPLDLTHRALTTPARLAAFRALGTRAGEVVAAWCGFFERYDREKYGTQGAPLHDPCVIAWLLAPEIFAGRRVNVEIETQGALTAGMSVIDWWGVTGRAANALVLREIDAEAFFGLLTERIGRL